KRADIALETLLGSASARGRIHILWTLAGLDLLNETVVQFGLTDPTSQVREQAIVLAAAMLDHKSIASKLLSLIGDSDARVRFRAAIAIGDLDSDEACAALAELASRDGEDPWIRAAILSSPPKRLGLMVQYYLKRMEAKAKDDQDVFLHEAMTILGAEGKAEVLAPLIQQIESTGPTGAFEKEAFWQGLLGGLRKNNRTLRQIFSDPKQASTQIVDRELEKARNSTTIPELSQSEQMSAIEWISHDEFRSSKKVLTKMLDGYPPQAVQIALINAISRFREPEVAQLLLDRWRQYTPKVRESVFDALMSRKERIEALLDRISKGEIAASTVDLVRKSQLLSYKDAAIQSLAKELLGDTTSTSRGEVVNRYREALSLQGNRERGQVLFTKHCAACHRWQGQGIELGPNLETIREWDADRILLNVFDPHREVTGQYLSYFVLLKDGRTLSGMIFDETATSLTIKQKDLVPQTVLLSEIEQISTSGQSLMPSGFEEVISLQDTADLLELLKNHDRN
ncbi:MAG TPA: HEAT repeat domain-containing protein, partial [Pirellula sp.]|nr:HEAT repeat domain-containing protein [Pirellula sp.]